MYKFDGSHPSLKQLAGFVAMTLDYARKPPVRLAILVVLHTFLFAIILLSAFWIRYEFQFTDRAWSLVLQSLPLVVGLKVVLFYLSGHFHGWWRYVTFGDLIALFRATTVSLAAMILLGYLTYGFVGQVPRSVVLLDSALTILCIGSLRSSWRLFDEQFGPALKRRKFRPALIVGCDHLTGQLASQVNARQGLDYRIKALVAVGDYRRHARLGHLPVAGDLNSIVEIAEKFRAKDVLVPAGVLPAERLRSLVEQCNDSNLDLKILPPLDDVLQGTNDIPVRSLDINDLLRRDPVVLDNHAIGGLISGRRVMVTGAGGSIGSEICRQVKAFLPSELILVVGGRTGSSQ
ncbi:Capsular polysaccharide biosynthesis protein capD [Rhodopirellula sallentina SM41]|uniref:Capsular polysaccharide biosynthesis protein capD n=1 Tax=Rhodopirellula sallentina SM41 TaxID=1263870 RepID=M5TZ77_9BACT|nr:Capsular polysaccharide biosynthesis protein capD [Rhodopirellula sallentina SM41]